MHKRIAMALLSDIKMHGTIVKIYIT